MAKMFGFIDVGCTLLYSDANSIFELKLVFTNCVDKEKITRSFNMCRGKGSPTIMGLILEK